MTNRSIWKFNPDIKVEKFLFLFAVLINCFPVLTTKYVVTMDGAAHLANATYVHQLAFESNDFIVNFFNLNSVIVPNWLGHALLVFFKSFLPGYIAEKTLLLIYLIALPYGFRFLIKQLNPSGILMSYWILPFSFNVLFLLGFYNFSLGIVLLFWTLGYWVYALNKGPKKIHFVFIGLGLLLTYFSHIFVFGLEGILLLFTGFTYGVKKAKTWKERIRIIFQLYTVLTLIALPSIILALIYIIKGQGNGMTHYKSPLEIINFLRNLQPLIIYNFDAEIPYVKKYTYIFGVFLFTVVIQKILLRKKERKGSFFNLNDGWILITVALLIALFILPDETNAAGFISIRLALLVFICLLIWVAAQIQFKPIILLSLLPLIFIQFKRLTNIHQVITENNPIALELEECAKKVNENSTVLPINYSNHWLYGHLPNYLAADKPVVVLENYEANLPYFPVVWNFNALPNLTIDTLQSGQFNCLSWLHEPKNPKQSIDFVLLLDFPQNSDSCNVTLYNMLKATSKKIYHGKHLQLFQIKQSPRF